MPDKEPEVVTLTNEDLLAFIMASIRVKKNPDNVVPNAQANWKAFKEVKLPKDGGIYTYYWDDPFPQKGFPHSDTVEKVDEIKKMMMAAMYGFENFKGKWLLAIFYLIFRKRVGQSLLAMVDQMNRMLAPHALDPIRYCISVRAVHDAMPDSKQSLLLSRLRNVICMVLEFDDAYRYRFQYTLGQIDRERFNKSPLAELSAALKKMEEAEIDERLRGMWRMMQKLLPAAYLIKDFRNGIVQTINQLDLAKVRLDEADRHYAKMHHNLFTKDNHN